MKMLIWQTHRQSYKPSWHKLNNKTIALKPKDKLAQLMPWPVKKDSFKKSMN